MIDKKLLEQLGWGTELINEVETVAQSLRESISTTDIVGYSTEIYLAGNQIHAPQHIEYSTESITLENKASR